MTLTKSTIIEEISHLLSLSPSETKHSIAHPSGQCPAPNLPATQMSLYERTGKSIDFFHVLLCPPGHGRYLEESLLETMKSTLASGEDLMVSGFGRFQVNGKAPRKGRNPATGEDMTLDKRRTVTFKCSGTLRNQIKKI